MLHQESLSGHSVRQPRTVAGTDEPGGDWADEPGGALLLETQLRVLVDLPARGDHELSLVLDEFPDAVALHAGLLSRRVL